MNSFHAFQQSLNDYKNDYGNLSDNLDTIIVRVNDDMENIKVRLTEKTSELNQFHLLQNEYDDCIETILKVSQTIETKIQKSHNIDLLQVMKD